MQQGAVVGEMALFSGMLRTATVLSLGDGLIGTLRFEDLGKLGKPLAELLCMRLAGIAMTRLAENASAVKSLPGMAQGAGGGASDRSCLSVTPSHAPDCSGGMVFQAKGPSGGNSGHFELQGEQLCCGHLGSDAEGSEGGATADLSIGGETVCHTRQQQEEGSGVEVV